MAAEQNPYISNESELPKNLVPVEPDASPIGAPAPPTPHDMPPLFSGSMPPQLQHDTSFVGTKIGTPRIPTHDLMPLGLQANPSTNAAVQSTSSKVTQTAIAAIPPADAADIESIFTNVQTGTQYTVQVSDRVKLVSMNNNSGGTVVLPAGTTIAGRFEHAQTNSGNSATASCNGTPYYPSDSVIMYAATTHNGLQQSPITFTPGTWTKLYGPGGGDEQLYVQTLSNAGGISPSAPISPSTAWVTTLAFFQNTSSISLVQRANGGGGGLGSGTYPIAFGSNNTKGNSIIVFITVASYTNSGGVHPLPSTPTDTAGNTYKLIATSFEDLGSTPAFSAQTYIWIAENIVAGPNTANVVLTGAGFIGATIWGYELALNGTSVSSGFDDGWYCYIENTGSGTYDVVSPADIDGVSGATIALGPNSGLIVAFDGTNWFTERGAGGGGIPPQNTPAITHEVLTAFNATTGVFTQAQLTQADIAAGVIANGSTATTQAAGDNTAQVATDAFVTAAIQGIISGTTPADGMRHGDPVWWADSSYNELRDDFIAYNSPTVAVSTAVSSPLGELGWMLFGSSRFPWMVGGNPPHMGIMRWGTVQTGNGYAGLMMNNLNGATTPWLMDKAFALLENPGWHCSWVWKFTGEISSSSPGKSTFNKKSFYIGLTGSPILAVKPSTGNSWTSNSARPDYFIGLRYDTSQCPQAWGINSVAAASGGTTVYTPNAASGFTGGVDTYKNCTVVVTNCVNAANNGTFTCTTSSSTTLTLNNAAGVVESNPVEANIRITKINITGVTQNSPAAGQATYTYVNTNSTTNPGANGGYIGMSFTGSGFTNAGNNVTATCIGSTATSIILNITGVTETPTANAAFLTPAGGPGDSNFTFEVVENSQWAGTGARHDAQGTTSGTGITPQLGNWYRLDMSCTTAGQVVMTLIDENNATSASHTFTVPQVTCSSGNISITTNANGLAFLGISVTSSASGVPTIQTPPFTAGSTVTVSGLTGALSVLNGAHILEEGNDGAGSVGAYNMYFLSPANPNLAATQTATLVGYPSLHPVCIWGDDDTGSSGLSTVWPGVTHIHVDFFSLAWNKAIASTSNAPNSAKSRYW